MDCPRIGKQNPASRCGAFERLWTEATQMTVAAGSVVEHLELIEDIGSSEISRFVDAISDALLVQTAEERFRDSIVPAVGAPAHDWLQIVGLAKPLEVVASILATLI